MTDQTQILVVDDESSIREILKRIVTKYGYDCYTAANADEAWQIITANHVDIVLTDIVMPGPSGMDLLRKIKANFKTDVIVMTGYAEDMKYENIIAEGASDFIIKPTTPQEVFVRVQRLLRERTTIFELEQAKERLNKSLGRLHRILQQTVSALGSAMEKRDPYTAGHQQKVTALSMLIARRMDIDEADTDALLIAGQLHDIGKIAVPTDILNKPTQLSIHERNILREHPQSGYDIIKDIEFSQPVAEIVLQHHERIDGSGYPRGLGKSDIIMQARILAVADVVEAMVSHRPYRPALGIQTAIEEIQCNRSVLYDEEIADICVSIISHPHFSITGALFEKNHE